MLRISCSFEKKLALATALLLISPLSPQANATGQNVATPEVAGTRPPADLDQGVITGELVTVAGNIFFQHFLARWRDQPLSERYSITVRERPSAIRGSQIKIECANRVVFFATLPNSRGDLKSFAERAVEIAYQNASQADIQRLLFRDADLGPDEL